MSVESKIEHTDLAKDAAVLSLCEVGLGSILHGLKLPLTGYFLSLNQIFLLARFIFKKKRWTGPAVISTIAATLKSLSPAGKKLTPMLAISAQGLFFSLGTMLGGANLLGASLGGIFSSVWAFVQPLLIYYFIFGKTLFLAFNFLLEKLQSSFSFISVSEERIWAFLAIVVVIKALLAQLLVFAAFYLTDEQYEKWQSKLLHYAKNRGTKIKTYNGNNPRELSFIEQLISSFKQMLNPLFILSLLLTLVFFIFVEASYSQVIWGLIRPIGLGVLIYLLFQILFTNERLSKMPNLQKTIELIKHFKK